MGADQPVALTEEDVLRLLKQAASDLGVKAWVVGGYVRDKLLGRPQPNPDVVVEGGDALKVAERFAELAHAGPPATFERYGTAQVTLPGRLVEFVTARAESYASDSRKPDVRPATLEEDLRRRDFTINTLLMDLDTLSWDESHAADMGIPLSMLPEIRSSSEEYGKGRVRGSLAGVPIAGILGDQQAATFGQACLSPGEAKNTYGTGNFVLLNTGTEKVMSQNGLLTTVF